MVSSRSASQWSPCLLQPPRFFLLEKLSPWPSKHEREVALPQAYASPSGYSISSWTLFRPQGSRCGLQCVFSPIKVPSVCKGHVTYKIAKGQANELQEIKNLLRKTLLKDASRTNLLAKLINCSQLRCRLRQLSRCFGVVDFTTLI